MGDGEATLIIRDCHEEVKDLYRAVCILYIYSA